MSTEERFNAAVNIIRNLPKHGPFQPSNGMMLKFYAYYKQAKEGPNVSSKPPFWDVINKAKWDAWKKLGNMSRETAMNKYVDEFKKIVDKLSHTHNIDDISDNEMNSLYGNIPIQDLQLLMGPSVVEKVCSRPGSPFSVSPLTSRETSPHRNKVDSINSDSEEYQRKTYKEKQQFNDTTTGLHTKYEDEEDSFLDTLENSSIPSKRSNSLNDKIMKINHDLSYGGGGTIEEWNYRNDDDLAKITEDKISRCSNTNTLYESCDDTNAAILRTLLKLNEDVEKVFEKLTAVEEHLANISKQIRTVTSKYSNERSNRYYAIGSYSPNVWLFFLILWPVIMQIVHFWFLRKRRLYISN